ncbi:Maf-like protein [Bacteroidia bacterium]|nr:Maf-like protein [Bacteroidia bacterium]
MKLHVILASGSPRRRELLSGMGFDFTVADKFAVEEVFPADMEPRLVPEYLAGVKSDACPLALGAGEVLLTADTVVLLEGEILGKPRDRREAIDMLTRMQGRPHTVVTGVVLRSPVRRVAFSDTTKVWFSPLSPSEIEHYVDTCRPMDKAGAYGVQEWIGYAAIQRIEGSFYNVMGLPTQKVYVALKEFASEK